MRRQHAIKLKYVANIFNGNSIPDSEKEKYVKKSIPYIPTKEISLNDGSINYNNGLSVNEDDGFRIAPPMSVLMCIEGGSAGRKIGFTDRPVAFVNKLCCFHGSKISKKFLYYALLSKDFTDQFFLNMTGLIGGVTTSTLKNLKVTVPVNIEEQHRIATYLDTKTSQIDALITNVHQQIEKLKAYKQSLITQVVTKGLNPAVAMKDSGVEWIGEIPEGWGVVQTKYCATINHGTDPKTEGNIPVYGSGAGSFKTCGEFKEGPAVLVGRKGATLHIPHYIEGKYWNVDTAFDVVTNSRYHIKFYYYAATSFDYKRYMSQTTLPGMTQTAYRNMYLPYPDKEEQHHIAIYLDTKCSQIDQLLALKQAKITKLEQYKKSLIYEYVTGKKEVPHGYQ